MLITDDTVTTAAKALWAHTMKDNREPEPWDQAGPQEREEVRQAVRLVLECVRPTLTNVRDRLVSPDDQLVEQLAQGIWDYEAEEEVEEGGGGERWSNGGPTWADAPEDERREVLEVSRRLLRLLEPILFGRLMPEPAEDARHDWTEVHPLGHQDATGGVTP